jgi:sulfatase modifying factor 1
MQALTIQTGREELKPKAPLDQLAAEMVRIPPGDFVMGSDRGKNNERPAHRVWVDVFAMAKYPVRRSDYGHFLESTGRPSPPYWEDPKFVDSSQPVVAPNWYDARDYCIWLSGMASRPYRLPTEAEREKAARGGYVERVYPWGDDLPQDHRGGRDALLEPVGSEGPNGYGLYDMSAGLHEWCADYYSASYYSVSPDQNPAGPQQGERRVARGGSWRHAVRFARCAARSSLAPDKYFSDFGFRCAMSIE